MKTEDKTLSDYLKEFLGESCEEAPEDVLRFFGHDQQSLSNTQILSFRLDREFEVGELPAIAAGYLIRSGYGKVTVEKQTFDKFSIPKGFEENSVFDHGSFIIGEDENIPTTVIQVSYGDNICNFAQHYY